MSTECPFPPDVRSFVASAPWRVAKTYASTWPHEYVVRTPANAELVLALARHIFAHGVDGRFYSQVRKYHHEDGKVYWTMDSSAESTGLVNRCDEDQTYEAREAAGTLPLRSAARRPVSLPHRIPFRPTGRGGMCYHGHVNYLGHDI